ncbi:MAG: hypothetical protein FJ286_17095 [Planctomycetes bacterium]|nr:hypothetical protein [Planctomycetota bacterium]
MAPRGHASAPRQIIALVVLAIGAGLGGTRPCGAEEGPLAPLDMSSPRATLDSFTVTIDRVAASFNEKGLDRDPAVRRENARLIRLVLGCLDLSAMPSSLVDMEGREAAVHLKEVLDRILLPPRDAVPDAAAVKTAAIDRWRLPGTEINLVRLAAGPRTGDFVFSTEKDSPVNGTSATMPTGISGPMGGW